MLYKKITNQFHKYLCFIYQEACKYFKGSSLMDRQSNGFQINKDKLRPDKAFTKNSSIYDIFLEIVLDLQIPL